MTKTCTGPCKETLPLDSFRPRTDREGKYHTRCKVCEKTLFEQKKAAIYAQQKTYYTSNVAKILAQKKVYKKANPDKVREHVQNRRASLVQATRYPVISGWWTALLDFYGAQCMNPECGSTENLSADHIVPLNRGGWHEFANWQILCISCNSSKRDLHETDYRPWPRLVDRKVS